MQIKICGMREAGNLWAIADLTPDFLGFIFYEKSARCVREDLDPAQVRSLPTGISKVGVFVDADLADVRAATHRYNLDYMQLHGHETPDYCQRVRALDVRVIKAFALDETFDFASVAAYESACDLFLFDTKAEWPGGNGITFDWQMLAGYDGTTPFFISGGLGPENLADLLQFQHPKLYGFDFNSKLELAPGLKDVPATHQLLARLGKRPTT